ncbi:MAG: amylo-alpha-1,6-glucosidase, partial [Candidatus Nanohaloarchaea archaeon]|nr:amylo-alpha-1,6-glucosidase [Candidatus Nanohaloarchaea archaeon]
AYRALHGAARLLETVLDRDRRAEELRDTAFELQERFNSDYWMEERSFYALAKTPDDYYADARTSNIGQCLWTGIIDQEQATVVVDQLMGNTFLTDHGIRTMAADSPGYSPVSYHNGSVWPHDNALIALGCARYGFQDEAASIQEAIHSAAQYHDNRLPEALCGFDDTPVSFPSSCRPQAWAAAAPFALERAARGDVPAAVED